MTIKSTYPQQCIKIIAEMVVNMNIVARIKLSSNFEKSSSEVGYYSYTKRCATFENPL